MAPSRCPDCLRSSRLLGYALLQIAILPGPFAAAAQFVIDPAREVAADPRPSEVLEHQSHFATSSPLFKNEWTDDPMTAGAGTALAVIPDLNGDCRAELLVAALGTKSEYSITTRSWSQGGNVIVDRGFVWAIAPDTARVLRAWKGAGPFDRFGTSMCALDDLDGDGAAELAIASPGADGGRGLVEIFDGRDGRRLRKCTGDEPGANFGASMVSIPDIDHDGLRDVAVGAPLGSGVEPESGCVLLVSTWTGAVLARIPGPQAGCHFGHALDATLDLTGDGVPDLVIGAPAYSPSAEFPDAGLVLVVSTVDGRIAGTIMGQWASQSLGVAVAALSPSDGSPLGQVVAASRAHAACDYSEGLLQFFRAPDFTQLRECLEPSETGFGHFGASLAVLDDLDGVGGPEVAVGTPDFEGPDDPFGVVFVFHSPGADERLHCDWSRWKGSDIPHGSFGSSIVRFPDLDGDGVDDSAIGAPGIYLTEDGGVQILSGRTRRVLFEITGEGLPLL